MTTFTLPERCDRAAAEALLPDLIEAIGNGAVAIDATGVRQVGQAALQLIASARKSGDGVKIASSKAFDEAASLTGLSQHLFGTDAP